MSAGVYRQFEAERSRAQVQPQRRWIVKNSLRNAKNERYIQSNVE